MEMHTYLSQEFDAIMVKGLKAMIAEAFICLEYNLRLSINKDCKELSERNLAYLEKKASQMKCEINAFIDSQVQRAIDSRNAQGHND